MQGAVSPRLCDAVVGDLVLVGVRVGDVCVLLRPPLGVHRVPRGREAERRAREDEEREAPARPALWRGRVVEQRVVAVVELEAIDEQRRADVPVSGLGRKSAALERPLEGRRVASKRLGALSRIKRGALGRSCGREGRGALPLPRAAVISTGSRVHARPAAVESRVAGVGHAAHQSTEDGGGHEAERGLHLGRARVRVRVRARVRVRVRVRLRASPPPRARAGRRAGPLARSPR